MRKERIYFLLMKPFTKKTFKNFYKYGFYVLLALFISGIIFTSIKDASILCNQDCCSNINTQCLAEIARPPVNNP